MERTRLWVGGRTRVARRWERRWRSDRQRGKRTCSRRGEAFFALTRSVGPGGGEGSEGEGRDWEGMGEEGRTVKDRKGQEREGKGREGKG
jgi:hypothetical protein